jgi:hypothetical protein
MKPRRSDPELKKRLVKTLERAREHLRKASLEIRHATSLEFVEPGDIDDPILELDKLHSYFEAVRGELGRHINKTDEEGTN